MSHCILFIPAMFTSCGIQTCVLRRSIQKQFYNNLFIQEKVPWKHVQRRFVKWSNHVVGLDDLYGKLWFIKILSSDKLDSHAQLMDSKCREACSSKAMTHKKSWGQMESPQWNQTLLWLRSNGGFNLFASRIFSGSATDSLCGVWGCGWTTSVLCAGLILDLCF